MLNIRQTKHLASNLATTVEHLELVLSHANDSYQELELIDPARPDKPRLVVNVRNPLRILQSRLFRWVLLKKLTPSDQSHGGVKGRSIKSNALSHLNASFVYKTDISSFYPSIHYSKVYRLFLTEFGCSPDVARLCTRLCTYKHHLALGLITSPFLADQILKTTDARIAAACAKAKITYTRYVDDITLSGAFDFRQSGIENVIAEILQSVGFRVNQVKSVFGRVKEMDITGIRICGPRLDVARDYLVEVRRRIADASNLATGEYFQGPYFLRSQILGSIHFITWVNPNRKKALFRRFRAVPWEVVAAEAKKQGLVARRKTLSPTKPTKDDLEKHCQPPIDPATNGF
ncbi:MAG: hypothetical protein JWN70_3178 [Planctomycetaceae bacterium]|nr:hypothetical protein [Planctomycetaceae bacterium]